jgi:hypothetical protein
LTYGEGRRRSSVCPCLLLIVPHASSFDDDHWRPALGWERIRALDPLHAALYEECGSSAGGSGPRCEAGGTPARNFVPESGIALVVLCLNEVQVPGGPSVTPRSCAAWSPGSKSVSSAPPSLIF